MNRINDQMSKADLAHSSLSNISYSDQDSSLNIYIYIYILLKFIIIIPKKDLEEHM